MGARTLKRRLFSRSIPFFKLLFIIPLSLLVIAQNSRSSGAMEENEKNPESEEVKVHQGVLTPLERELLVRPDPTAAQEQWENIKNCVALYYDIEYGPDVIQRAIDAGIYKPQEPYNPNDPVTPNHPIFKIVLDQAFDEVTGEVVPGYFYEVMEKTLGLQKLVQSLAEKNALLQKENASKDEENAIQKRTIKEFEGEIATLKEQVQQLHREIAALKDQAQAFQGEVPCHNSNVPSIDRNIKSVTHDEQENSHYRIMKILQSPWISYPSGFVVGSLFVWGITQFLSKK